MTKPTINRGSYLNFYNAANFSLTIPKKDKKAEIFLTFVIGDTDSRNYQVSSALVSRREAAHALKNFKKVLVKSRAKA